MASPSVGRPRGRPPRVQADPLKAEIAASKQDAIKDLRLVSSQVGISTLAELETAVSVPDFLRLKGLALIDLFWGLEDAKAALELEVSIEKLGTMREHEAMPIIRAKLMEAFQKVAGVADVGELAEAVEGQMAREQWHLALTGTNREKTAAMRDLLLRQSPLPSRQPKEGGNTFNFNFPPDLRELIVVGLAGTPDLKTLPPAPTENDDVIDAAVLNVPLEVEASEP